MKNLNQYVGEKVKGVEFESKRYRDIAFASAMKNFIGVEGTITEYYTDKKTFKVEFYSPYRDFWFYPAEVILPQLEGEIKGYLIKDEKYCKIIAKLAGVNEAILANTFHEGVHFYIRSHIYNIVVEYGLLDKCIPVYKDNVKLPKINGYEGEDKGDYLQYGCAQLLKSWFEKSENSSISFLELNSGVRIDIEEMDAIREYLKSKEKNLIS